jgi:hypothetical protein
MLPTPSYGSASRPWRRRPRDALTFPSLSSTSSLFSSSTPMRQGCCCLPW